MRFACGMSERTMLREYNEWDAIERRASEGEGVRECAASSRSRASAPLQAIREEPARPREERRAEPREECSRRFCARAPSSRSAGASTARTALPERVRETTTPEGDGDLRGRRKPKASGAASAPPWPRLARSSAPPRSRRRVGFGTPRALSAPSRRESTGRRVCARRRRGNVNRSRRGGVEPAGARAAARRARRCRIRFSPAGWAADAPTDPDPPFGNVPATAPAAAGAVVVVVVPVGVQLLQGARARPLAAGTRPSHAGVSRWAAASSGMANRISAAPRQEPVAVAPASRRLRCSCREGRGGDSTAAPRQAVGRRGARRPPVPLATAPIRTLMNNGEAD